jgi:hypothetical protein
MKVIPIGVERNEFTTQKLLMDLLGGRLEADR